MLSVKQCRCSYPRDSTQGKSSSPLGESNRDPKCRLIYTSNEAQTLQRHNRNERMQTALLAGTWEMFRKQLQGRWAASEWRPLSMLRIPISSPQRIPASASAFTVFQPVPLLSAWDFPRSASGLVIDNFNTKDLFQYSLSP
eukprot:Gb_20907 [translate_table: standard]